MLDVPRKSLWWKEENFDNRERINYLKNKINTESTAQRKIHKTHCKQKTNEQQPQRNKKQQQVKRGHAADVSEAENNPFRSDWHNELGMVINRLPDRRYSGLDVVITIKHKRRTHRQDWVNGCAALISLVRRRQVPARD